MVDHIKSLRNEKVHQLMVELSKEPDPNEEHALDASITMPKRELFDRLPRYCSQCDHSNHGDFCKRIAVMSQRWNALDIAHTSQPGFAARKATG